MPETRVEFHRLAAKEYREASQWYDERSAIAADRFRSGVALAVQRISSNPNSLPRLAKHYRWARIHHFPYMLVFRMRNEHEAIVLALAHTSRRPGYWKRRK